MSRPGSNGLTDTERKVLTALEKYVKEYGYAPSYREIGQMVGKDSTSHIKYCLVQLEKKGYIRRGTGTSRSIQIIRALHMGYLRVENALRLPISGRIQAGNPISIPDSDLARFDSETYVDVPLSHLPKNTEDLFALQVQGDSMIDAMIADGDIVVLHSVRHSRNGDMVAAWLPQDHETTLKKYYLEGDKIRLQPANSAYQAIIRPASEVEVQGIVVFVYRDYNRVH